ncbi:quinone-dependent dihydroorotate dehydrogenase [Helicobacter cappadocius]|uniref:Dihydroorotate dehydrogenase (quinone) n=1 Tax=Helicobacter cappadocius TaxID=3063998 RepID=A0AA90PLI0_9HELI|nr:MULTISPECIES: quinone-dependent dihydroorotate dehydrogenase [unclassified Helicobacter]MDO7253372.1 quinone-dependent dihydroorotate dehydrogenase [Helicobacter sp. faydin-H75]MDP2539364.1 quinone-dependent dihydroorotate dehydrogenase [Helicobacter sp. faydin-H76]
MSAYKSIRNVLFKIEPENIHNALESVLQALGSVNIIQDILAKNFCYSNEILKNEICGLDFYNPIGLAAGFDKNATMIKALSCFGFGFLEIGTVTKTSQKGNPKPRLFRFKEEQSIQNAMGFNNDGSQKVSSRISKIYPYALPIGINLGKNKNISEENALKNYEDVLKDFLDMGDYYVFNLSSPNTPNLRDLQNVNFVQELFLMAKSHTNKPVFLKISPDMEIDEMLKVCEMAIQKGADGIIATNTTIDYSTLSAPKSIGGISGNALRIKSRAIFEELSRAFFEKTTLISVGGIDDAQEAYRRIKMGASLVQIYTGFVFKGPSLCKNINSQIQEYLIEDGFLSIKDAIGVDLK